MVLPPGIQTRTLTVSPAVGTAPRKASLEVQIQPSKNTVVWTETQEPLAKMFKTIRTSPDVSAVLELPVVDQSGFVDETNTPITDWHYTITVRYMFDGRKVGQTVVKHFKPVSSTDSVTDFDVLPSGDAPENQGPAGKQGLSAYEVAVKNGFVGSEIDWLASLANGGDLPFLEYHQSTPSKEWVINHNFGRYPAGVSLTDSSGRMFLAPWSNINENTLVVTLSGAMSGYANLTP